MAADGAMDGLKHQGSVVPAAQLRGLCGEQFQPVVDLLERNLESGAELGVSMVVDLDGQTMLDVWGGYQDAAHETLWRENTITNVWSLSKTVVNMAALMLVAHGEMGLDVPVANYWPEFGQNGKREVLVRHILGHTSGVSGWEQPLSLEDFLDTETATALLAAQAPWWQPGTRSGYHAMTQGHLIGALIERITGIPLAKFVAEQVALPLQADFQLGVSEADWGRTAEIIPPPFRLEFERLPEDNISRKTFTGPFADAAIANTEGWRRSVIGAANGHGNARSISRILSTISLAGDVHGVSLLSRRAISKIFLPQAQGRDLALAVPMNFGVGYGLPTPETLPFIPEGRICFWGGWGGSLAVMDTERRLTITFVMNKMGAGIIGSETSASYIKAVYECLGVPAAGSD